jgi:hypothetical protein
MTTSEPVKCWIDYRRRVWDAKRCPDGDIDDIPAVAIPATDYASLVKRCEQTERNLASIADLLNCFARETGEDSHQIKDYLTGEETKALIVRLHIKMNGLIAKSRGDDDVMKIGALP